MKLKKGYIMHDNDILINNWIDKSEEALLDADYEY